MAKHNVDLSKLSLAQLQQLMADAAEVQEKLEAQEHEAAIQATKKSGDFQTLKSEFKALKQFAKGIESKYTFQIVLPINVEVKSECYIEDLLHYDQIKDSGIFNVWFSGKIDKNCDLTPKQYKVLNEQVSGYLADACDDFLDVVPEEYHDKIKEFTKRANALIKSAKKLNLTVEDLQ